MRFGLGAALLLLHAAAVAQSASDAGNGTPVSCELHVWPGTGLGSVYHGWFHGGINNGAIQGRDGYPVIPATPMETPAQHDLLAAMPLDDLVALKGYRKVVHDAALESRVIRGTPGRIVDKAAPCYAELIVDDLVYQQDVIDGRYLKMLMRFRDFGTGDTPVRSFGTWTKVRLVKFPPETPETEQAAVEELHEAFKSNVETFAAFLTKPERKRK
jgi:hypothetical protein